MPRNSRQRPQQTNQARNSQNLGMTGGSKENPAGNSKTPGSLAALLAALSANRQTAASQHFLLPTDQHSLAKRKTAAKKPKPRKNKQGNSEIKIREAETDILVSEGESSIAKQGESSRAKGETILDRFSERGDIVVVNNGTGTQVVVMAEQVDLPALLNTLAQLEAELDQEKLQMQEFAAGAGPGVTALLSHQLRLSQDMEDVQQIEQVLEVEQVKDEKEKTKEQVEKGPVLDDLLLTDPAFLNSLLTEASKEAALKRLLVVRRGLAARAALAEAGRVAGESARLTRTGIAIHKQGQVCIELSYVNIAVLLHKVLAGLPRPAVTAPVPAPAITPSERTAALLERRARLQAVLASLQTALQTREQLQSLQRSAALQQALLQG